MGTARNVDRRQILATLGMVAFFALAVAESAQFRGIGQWFPLLATGCGLLVALAALAMQLAGRPFEARAAFDAGAAEPAEPDQAEPGEAVPGHAEPDQAEPGQVGKPPVGGGVVIGWVVALPVLVALVGTTLAVAGWLPAFLLFVAKLSWRVALPVAAGAVVVVTGLRLYLGLELPASALVG